MDTQRPPSAPPRLRFARLERGLVGLCVALAALQAWSGRFSANPDGISYLDLASHRALSAYWSPLYSWLVLLPAAAFGPEWEFPLAHAGNFLVFLAALAAFRVLLRSLEALTRSSLNEATIVASYAAFLWCSLGMIGLSDLTPDLLVAAVHWLATALLLTNPSDRRRVFALGFGVLLGLGYLSKAVMFPLGFVFLAAFLLSQRRQGGALARSALAVAGFLVVTLPFVTALSLRTGRITFGESGRLNYAWFVNRTHPFMHWQGGPGGRGVPLHPTRRISDTPAAFEFSEPIEGTYPPWYDPAHWYSGIKAPFVLNQQARAIAVGGFRLLEFLAWPNPLFLPCLLILNLAAGAPSGLRRRLTELVPALLPSLLAIALYLLVIVQTRYLGGPVLVAFLALLPAARTVSAAPALPARLGAWSLLASTLVAILFSGEISARSVFEGKNRQWEVAQAMHRGGIDEGERVLLIGDPMLAFWARLARVRIVAEVPPGEVAAFWRAPKDARERIVEAARQAGATALVADQPPPRELAAGWLPLGGDRYFALRLPSPPAPPAMPARPR